MNTGKYAAYKQLTTPKSDLSDTIVKQEELQNQFEEKQELKAEKKKKKQIAKTKDIARINPGDKTQYLNVEHTFMDGFKKQGGIIEVYSNAKEAFEKDPTNTEAYGIMQNINKGVEKIGLMKETIMAYDKLMSEGIANKSIDPNRNKKFRSVLKELNNGEFNLNIDKYGVISIENLAIDRDEDGKLDVITPESLSDKNAWGDWQGLFNLNAFNTKMKKDFGTKREKGQDPKGKLYDTIETKGFNPANTLLVRDRYKQAFGKDRDSITSDGVSILYQNGFDLEKNPITKEQYESFLDAKVTEFKQMYDSSELKENNARTRIAAQEALIKLNKALKDGGKTNGFDAMTDIKTGKALTKKFDGIDDDKKYTGFVVGQLEDKSGEMKPLRFIVGKDDIEVSEFYINELNEIIFSGRKKEKKVYENLKYKNGKVIERTKKEGKDSWVITNNSKLNQTAANLLAVSLGYSNSNELVKAARKKINGLTPKPKPVMVGNHSYEAKD